jgi:hypothetical protein
MTFNLSSPKNKKEHLPYMHYPLDYLYLVYNLESREYNYESTERLRALRIKCVEVR